MFNLSRKIALLSLVAGALAGCGGGNDDKEKFGGDRISVLSFETNLRQDPRLRDAPVQIIPAFRNSAWANPGGFASHAAYHLEIDGLGKGFAVNAVTENSALARMKAPPVVADGKVFAMGAELDVVAVDAQNGAKLWTRSVMAEYTEPNHSLTRFLGRAEKPAEVRDGFGGGLAYGAGRVFVTTGFGEVLALDADSGEIIWRIQNSASFSNAPTLRNGRVYVASQDSRLHAFSADDGARLWEHLAIDEQATIIGASSVAVTDQVVIAGFNSGEVVALSPVNGQVAWSDSLTSRATQVTPLSQLNAIVGRPVIDRDRVFVTSHGGRTAAIDLRTGERIWTADVGSIETPWAMGDYVLVMSLDGELVALSREQGRIRWISELPAFEDMKDREGRISYAGPLLGSGQAIIVSSTGQIITIDPTNGAISETINIKQPVNVPPVIANGTLYLLSDEGRLIARR